MRLNILVIDRSPPLADTQGNELIARHLFPLLRADHHLTLLAAVIAGEEAGARAGLEGLFDAVHLVPRRRRMPALGGWLEASAARRGVRLGGRIDVAAAIRFRREIERILATESVDVVHVRQLPMAAFAPDIAGRPALLELVDSETLASRRARASSLRATVRRGLAGAIERRAIRAFPIVTTVADADADVLRRLRPGLRVEVIPNGVDADRFRPMPDVAVQPASLVFVGAMSFPPNVAAMHWFADDVLPRIRAVHPAATLTVVGRDPAPSIVALGEREAVTVTGGVDDVRPFLAGGAVVVAPMVSGSGIKNKVLEALATGRPVVATPLAVEGLSARDGREIVVADGPSAFASAVVALIADPARAAAIGASGRALVEDAYTWEACAARYAGLYAELAARGGPGTPS